MGKQCWKWYNRLDASDAFEAMDDVARVREKIDIVGLISEYITIKKAGRNFKALCPFHNEKTPSFVISPERQIWHCFGGCSKGGDCFEFLMEYEHMEFGEALRTLAKKAGIELTQSSYQSGLSSKKEKIYKLNFIANEFYHYVLTRHAVGKKAFDYFVKERKIDERLINTFQLGFSPKSQSALSNYLLNKKGYKKEELVEAGLAFYRGSDLVDFFRGRIMFPLIDHRGNIVGFSGRQLVEDANFGGKYVNTKETLVYHKGSMFFGLNIALQEIKKKDFAIIVEGEFDVMSMYKEGIDNVVAVKGSALTDDQVALLSRFTQNISLCFDQDDAGFKATERSLEALEKKNLNVKVIVISKGKDPDEAINIDPYSVKKDIKGSIAVYDYLFSRTFSVNDKSSIEGKKKIGDFLLPIILRIENEIVKEHYLKKLAKELDTTYESLMKQAGKSEQKKSDVVDRNIVKKDKRSRKEILEEYLMALLVQNENPKSDIDKTVDILKDYVFDIPSYGKILGVLKKYFEKNEKFDNKEFSKVLPVELISYFDPCFLYPLPKFRDKEFQKKEIEKVSREMRMLFLKNKIKSISGNLRSGERSRDAKEIDLLEKEISSLIRLLPRD